MKHLQNPSIEYNEKGEIYDQPKKAIYGIKIAKNAFWKIILKMFNE